MNATGAHPIPSWHLADRRGAEKGKVPRWVSDNPVAALQGCPFWHPSVQEGGQFDPSLVSCAGKLIGLLDEWEDSRRKMASVAFFI